MSFSKDALLHELQDKIDSFFRDNIVIPIAWRKDEDGQAVYDIKYMRSEFEWAIDELEQIIIEEHNERKR
jgi:hypothetical protein